MFRLLLLFRSKFIQDLLRSSLQSAIKYCQFRSAKHIFDKLAKSKIPISTNPECEINLYRIFSLLDSSSSSEIREKLGKCQKTLTDIFEEDNDKDLTNVLLLKDKYECPICFVFMSNPLHVFKCQRGHFICSTCLPNMESCPQCRDNFKGKPPQRCREDEKLTNRIPKMFLDQFKKINE